MLIVRTDESRESTLHIQTSGSIREITASVCGVISGVYRDMLNAHPLAGMYFRELITRMVNDSNSPLWDEEGASIAKEDLQ